MQPKLKECAHCKTLKVIWKSEGKLKYCKDCWHQIKPPAKIRKVSGRMREVLDEYSKKRLGFLIIHSKCQAKLQHCTGQSTQVHHKKGRGEHHNDMSTWLAVCHNCHVWIENNPEEAKELGFSLPRID